MFALSLRKIVLAVVILTAPLTLVATDAMAHSGSGYHYNSSYSSYNGSYSSYNGSYSSYNGSYSSYNGSYYNSGYGY